MIVVFLKTPMNRVIADSSRGAAKKKKKITRQSNIKSGNNSSCESPFHYFYY